MKLTYFLVLFTIWHRTHAQSYHPSYIPFVRADYYSQDQGNVHQINHFRKADLNAERFIKRESLVTEFLPEYNQDVKRLRRQSDESRGLLSSAAFSKISETLGALNTVGRYLVNMTRGQDVSQPLTQNSTESIPDAILILTKNVLGQNMTKTIEPLIKRVGTQEVDKNSLGSKRRKKKREQPKKDTELINREDQLQIIEKPQTNFNSSLLENVLNTTLSTPPAVSPARPEDIQGKEGENRCITPQGKPGTCEDLSVCPELLLNLGDLRDSLCFKRLFLPGVCCPLTTSTVLTTQKPTILTVKPQPPTPPPPPPPPSQQLVQNLILAPQTTPPTTTVPTTKRPVQLIPIQTIQTQPTSVLPAPVSDTFGNIVDPSDCGQQEYSSGRIVGGIEAANGEWPWVAAIFLHGAKRTEFWCGGSLIGSKYVLTAAHCTRDSRQKPFAARQFTVRLGDIDLSTDNEPSAPVTFKVTEVRTHARFSRVGFYNDIAILVLDRPVRKSKYVIPVCLPNPGSLPAPDRLAGRRATVVGWGTTYYGGKESTVQREADLPIWRNEDCNRAYFQPITENFVCAGYSEGGVDACQGDSGGPLMMRINNRWTQLGVVSFGNKCGEPGYPGVYTRISQYIDWIEENTKN